MKRAWGLVLLAGLLLAGCGKPLPMKDFAGTGNFNPLVFFTGHVTSWGVMENRDGAPTAIITTDCEGVADQAGQIRMVQVLHRAGAPPQTRIWQMAQTGPERFEASANDMDGTARGVASGRVFHWQWVLENKPGNALENVTMSQWMYRMDDGSVLIRTVVTKLNVTVLQISEVFRKA